MEKGNQKIIAEKLGVSQQSLNMVLRGVRHPSWEIAKKLARLLKVSPALVMEASNYWIVERLEALVIAAPKDRLATSGLKGSNVSPVSTTGKAEQG